MPNFMVLLRRHPAIAYFTLTFALSWGSVLLVVLPRGPAAERMQFEELFALACLAMLVGPSTAGLVSTGLVHGKKGFRDLLSRLLRWRAGLRWYAALMAAPLTWIALLFAFRPFSPGFPAGFLAAGDWAAFAGFGLVVGLMAGFFEELGWTGFATPLLRQRYGVFASGLVLGLFWAAWHFLVKLWGIGGYTGDLSPALFLPCDLLQCVAQATAFRILMVWVHDGTRSLFLAVLMHLSFTASVLALTPPVTGAPLLWWNFAVAAVLWGLVAAVALSRREALTWTPGRKACQPA